MGKTSLVFRSEDQSRGLPYSKPTHFQLSYAAPYLLVTRYDTQADALEGDGRGGEAVCAAGPPAAQPAALQTLPEEPHRQTSRGWERECLYSSTVHGGGGAVLRIRDVYPGSYFFPSRIRTVYIPDPGSASKNLSILTPQKKEKWFLSSRKYDPGYSSRIRMPTFYPSRIPDPGSKRHRIPDPDPQHCGGGGVLIFLLSCGTIRWHAK